MVSCRLGASKVRLQIRVTRALDSPCRRVSSASPSPPPRRTIPSRFQALDAINGNRINCYDPLQGDALFSNNYPWNDPP